MKNINESVEPSHLSHLSVVSLDALQILTVEGLNTLEAKKGRVGACPDGTVVTLHGQGADPGTCWHHAGALSLMLYKQPASQLLKSPGRMMLWMRNTSVGMQVARRTGWSPAAAGQRTTTASGWLHATAAASGCTCAARVSQTPHRCLMSLCVHAAPRRAPKQSFNGI